jgi:hypothetical protein
MQYNPILLRSIPDEKAALSILDIEKFLVAHFENTFFFFYISNKDGEIEICLNHFSYPWYKSYSSLNIEDIDILRYAKILMDLIMPWRILSFSIERK